MTADDQVLDDLRRVLSLVDDPPPRAVEAAKAALDWRSVDAELARLVQDSAGTDTTAELIMRGAADDARTLTFTASELTIEVEIAGGQLMGSISPAKPCTVELHQPGREASTTATDDFGMFSFTGLGSGSVSLWCRSEDGGWSVRTAWS
jgi:hypothetical protein